MLRPLVHSVICGFLLSAQIATAAPTFTQRIVPLGTRQFPVRLVGGADLTGDGLADLVAMTDSGSVMLLARDASGNFQVSTIATDAVYPFAVALADFNGDNRGDLIYAVTNAMQVRLQSGGGFVPGPRVNHTNTGPNAFVEAVVAGDIDGDHRADVAMLANDEFSSGNPGRGGFAVWGVGTLPYAGTIIALHEYPRRLFGIDANGDGILDLYGGSAGMYRGITRYNPGVSGFVYGALPTTGFDAIVDASPGDINGDGKTDIALLFEGRDWNHLRFERGGGDFSFVQQGVSIETPFAASGVRLGDFDGDGKADVLLALQSNGKPSAAILRGRGDFTFEAPQFIEGGFNAGGLARGHYNGDNKLDFALVDTQDKRIVVYLQN
jgi:hypothetical protein